jgi:hypothetical protein
LGGERYAFAIQSEPYSPLWHELTTVVIFGPTDFQVDDYKWQHESLQDFLVKFVYLLTGQGSFAR